jgi:two-component system LytT family response regulator
MNGFEMLDHLHHISYEVIFVTSYNQYAIEAIRYSALDYLLKPLKDEELIKSIERFENKKERTLTPTKITTLQHNMRAVGNEDFQLIIPTRTGERQFPVNQIVRLEADSNYTWIHALRTAKFLASKTLKELEEQLSNNNFIRAHKSHLVNRKHILQLTEEGQLVLRDESRIEVSRRKLSEVKALFHN